MGTRVHKTRRWLGSGVTRVKHTGNMRLLLPIQDFNLMVNDSYVRLSDTQFKKQSSTTNLNVFNYAQSIILGTRTVYHQEHLRA